MTIKGEIIEVGGGRWKVREAKTREDALNAIASARCSGSVGARQTDDKRLCGGALDVLAALAHGRRMISGCAVEPWMFWQMWCMFPFRVG